jgi:hypothetical protein
MSDVRRRSFRIVSHLVTGDQAEIRRMAGNGPSMAISHLGFILEWDERRELAGWTVAIEFKTFRDVGYL